MENRTQKVYNLETKELYGEYDICDIYTIKYKYVKGEIPEKLCYIDENGNIYEWDEYADIKNYNSYHTCMERQQFEYMRKFIAEKVKKINETTTNN